MVDPNLIVGVFVKDFNFDEFMGFDSQKMRSSEESSQMTTTNFLANVSTFIFILMVIVSFVLLLLILVCVCKKAIS